MIKLSDTGLIEGSGSCTSFGKLDTVVVGREVQFSLRQADFSFKHFYKEALGQEIYDSHLDYSVNKELCDKRNEQLDNLAKLIVEHSPGTHVLRPDPVTGAVPFHTPEFKSELSSASNVRDITLVYGNKIIETPVFVRNRYFENKNLYDCYKIMADIHKYEWIRAPHTVLTEENMDLDPWNNPRDYSVNNLDENGVRVTSKYIPAIDGAQFLRIGSDCIVNINSYNHYAGYLWVKRFFPEVTFHVINVADNHIDGAILCLAPGVFLCNPKYPNLKEQLPEKFQDWKFIYPRESNYRHVRESRLASINGMDINVLSLNEKDVICTNDAVWVADALNKHGFNPIQVNLENCELFGGGVHCSTLDLARQDDMINYTGHEGNLSFEELFVERTQDYDHVMEKLWSDFNLFKKLANMPKI